MRYLVLFLLLTVKVMAFDSGWYLFSTWGYMHSINSVMAVNSTSGDIVHRAQWESKAFEDSPYYTLRIENWQDNNVSGIEWVHHKIYLKNNPSTIEDFSISDGYNMLFYNVGKRNDGIIRKWGAGIVVAHPDVTLTGRDRFWNDGGISGAYFAGFAVQHSIETWFYETTHHVLSLEGKITAAYARIPISDDDSEYADVPNIAFHITLGLGSKPLPKKPKPIDYANYFGVPILHHYSIYQFSKLTD